MITMLGISFNSSLDDISSNSLTTCQIIDNVESTPAATATFKRY